MDFFPGNVLTHFHTRLYNEIDLSRGSWEVGLTEIQFPHNWHVGIELKGRVRVYEPDTNTDPPTTKLVSAVLLRDKKFAALQQLIEYINQELEADEKGGATRARFAWVPSTSEVLAHTWKSHVIILSPDVAKVLGLPLVIKSHFSRGVASTIGNPVRSLYNDITALYVYCNMVEPNYVGDSLSPLLRVVSTEGVAGEISTMTYANPMYHSVKKSLVHDIEIDIRDDTGEPVQFTSGRVVVVLHLRRSGLP